MPRHLFALLTTLCLSILCAGCGQNAPEAVATLAPTAVAPTPEEAVAAQPTAADAADAAGASDAAPAGETTPAPPPSATPRIVPTATPGVTQTPTPAPPATYTFEIVNTYPHDPNAFTQGLVIDEGRLYEGTGRWAESTLREVALETGAVLRSQPLEDQYFGEGITILGDRIFQLTWQEETGFIYDKATFAPLQTFNYPHEGWGITHDGTRLIVSDGTPIIRFWDPETLQETGRITVRDHEGPLTMLNELEYVDGEIWANIWLTDRIARISPETGDVLGYIDLTGLLDTTTLTQPADVLNGIAFDAASGRLFVTGKLWPALFEIRVVPVS